jgi:cytosine/adenosine deaminase-related metal-dependent hydrolase
MAFEEWLPRLVKALRDWKPDDYAASAAVGIQRTLQSGVTVVGDIVYGPESAAVAADLGLGGVFYWEVLGIEARNLRAAMKRQEFPASQDGACGLRVKCGLSPHSVYTSGPGLLRAVRDLAIELDAPYAIHVAESAAETQLLRDGSGSLAATAARVAHGFVPPGTGPVTYLDRLGAIDGATAVHLCQVLPTEIPRLASTVRGAVTCPRSNRYLHNAVPRVERLLHNGIAVGIGTDSSASNEDLDLMAEVRALHLAEPDIPVPRLLEMATTMGAAAIGVEDRFGVIEPGMQADFAVFALGATGEPEAAVLSSAGRDTVRSVMAAGQWRVLDGELVSPRPEDARGALRAADTALAALAGDND